MIKLQNIIENNNVEAVTTLDNSELPSLIQMALCESACEIANIALDKLTDVNVYVDGELEGWKLPLLHVAITSTLMNSRFPRPAAEGPKNDGSLFELHLAILKKMIDKGADMSATDTYGNLPVMRAVLDALAIDLGITDDEFDEDVETVFELLVDSGCDIQEKTDTRQSVQEMFRNNVVLSYFPQ